MKNSLGDKFLESALLLLLVFGFSFLLNSLWEVFHAVYLYQQHDFDASNYVPMLLYVATMDSLIIEGLYLGLAAASRRLFWIKSFLKRHQLTYVWAGAQWQPSSSTGPDD